MGVMFFFLGMLIMFFIDITISHKYEFEEALHHHFHFREHTNTDQKSVTNQLHNPQPQKGKHQHRHRHRYGKEKVNLEKTSLLVFLGVFIHNIPEGMVTFVSTLRSVQLGILLATAIALHNIPEGIAVSVPIYQSTGSRKKAFFWSFFTGISEFIGALVFGIIFYQFINDFLLGAMLAVVAGFMVYISLDELLPVSHSLGREHFAILGIMMGMFVMFISLTLL
jgi:ZIP family zinc transporter